MDTLRLGPLADSTGDYSLFIPQIIDCILFAFYIISSYYLINFIFCSARRCKEGTEIIEEHISQNGIDKNIHDLEMRTEKFVFTINRPFDVSSL